MRTNNEHISPVKALVMRWRALALSAVAFARTIALHAKCDPARAARDAEMLEVWLRFALFGIVGDLARLNADGEDHLSYDDDLQYLRQIAASLAVMAMFCANIKRECGGRAGFVGCGDPGLVPGEVRRDVRFINGAPHDVRCTLQAHAFPNLGFLDSS